MSRWPRAGRRGFTYEGLKTWVDAVEARSCRPGRADLRRVEPLQELRDRNAREPARRLADMIREKYGLEKGFVIEMSGTPSPKSPVDWWSQCEIAWPGFLREGSQKAMEERMAFMVQQTVRRGHVQEATSAGRTTSGSAPSAARPARRGPHELDGLTDPADYHDFKPSKNEVAYLYKRLKGLVTIKHKKDCLDLPDKRYRKIICKPTASILRVAEAIVQAAPNAITGMTLLRELSDGFQYREVQDGMTRCTHCRRRHGARVDRPGGRRTRRYPGHRHAARRGRGPAGRAGRCPARSAAAHAKCPSWSASTREVPCPKDAALKMLLDENEETGRLVVFAGFTGSVDRVVNLASRKSGTSCAATRACSRSSRTTVKP